MVVVMHTIMAILLAWRLGFAEYVGWLLKSQPNLKRVNFNLFFEDRAHGEPKSTIGVAPFPVPRIQVHIVNEVFAYCVFFGRCPVEAVRANVVEGTIVVVAQAGRGEKHIRSIISP